MEKLIYAYTIENDKLSKAHSDFTKKFIAKLHNANAVKQRCYEVNADTRESDILLKYREEANVLYGIIARIKPTKDMPSLPADLWNAQRRKPSPRNDRLPARD